MPNIMINQVCNLNCKYCFADETVNTDGADSNNMSFEAFKQAVKLCGCDRIGIIGGEPTIHPQFKEFVEYAQSVKQKKQSIIIFTNGINLDKYWRLLLKAGTGALWNFNGPEVSGKQWVKIKKNADLIFNEIGLQDKISLGLNLYAPDMDWKFFTDACKEYKPARARLSVTVPNRHTDLGIDHLARLKRMMPVLLDVCEELADAGVRFGLDCTILPQCVYTDEDAKRIIQFCDKLGLDAKEAGFFRTQRCSPVLDIMPDLSITRCFGCSEMKKLQYCSEMDAPIGTYRDVLEANQIFEKDLGTLAYVVPAHADCIDCVFRKRGVCQGGCLGYKKDKILETTRMLEESFRGFYR